MKTQQRYRASERPQIRIDRSEAAEALAASTLALTGLLRRHGHADRPIPHLSWTVSQCAAHMLISNWMYADQMTGPGIFMRIEETS